MLQKLNIFFEQLSIRKKTYLIILLSVTLLLVFFSIIFNVMVADLQKAVVSKNTQALSLICTDLDNYNSTLQAVSSHILRNDYVKKYISSSSTPSDKSALQSQMSRNAYNNTYFNIPLTSGSSGFMIARSESDFVYVNSSSALTRDAYEQLAAYTFQKFNPVSGNSYVALPSELFDELNFLCFALPVSDIDSSTLRTGGYLILFVSQYNVMKTLAKYYEDDFTILITDKQDNVIFNTGNEDTPPVYPEESDISGTTIRAADGSKTLVLCNRLNNMNWSVFLQTPLSSVTSQLTEYRLLFFFVVLLIVCISFLMVTVFSRSITRRLTEMTDVINNIRKGDIDCRYPVVYHDEISLIGSEFNRMVDQIQNYHLNAAMQELKQREAELHALQSNINPHFLYNSLDCIRSSALVNNDVRTAHQIQILANMFRYTVSTGTARSETVTIEAEMDHVYDYLSMLSFRFEDRYFVDINISNRILPLYTLKLILQPVIENAFHHGVRNMASGGRVRICGDLDEADNCVRFTIEDNGVGIRQERLQKLQTLLSGSPLSVRDGPFMGLVNINDRIHIAYGREYGLSVESTYGSGTRVTIRIPIITGQGDGSEC